MKTLQIIAPRKFRIIEVSIPQPGPGEVLLRINAVTTCPQWDLHIRHNEPMSVGHCFSYPYMPGQPGHEATGVIEALGLGVTGLAVGERVSAWRDPGHHVPGCYAQFVVHQAENVIRVPDNLPDQALAPVELAMCVGTVFRMLREMNAIRGRVFGVTGLGPAGLVALQMARSEGAAEVFGFDPLASRHDLARCLGASDCYDSTSDLNAMFPNRPKAPRLQTAVDCVGTKSSVEFLMDHTQDVVALFGVQREDYTFAIRHYTLSLCGYMGYWRESAEYAVDLIRQGRLNLAPLVSYSLPLERYNEGIDLLEARKAIKICYLPWA